MPDQNATVADQRGQTRAEALAEALAAEIREGRLQPGRPLPPERVLCDRFAASRSSVRDALQMLGRRGYADLSAARRPIAARPSVERILSDTAGHIRALVGDAEMGAYLEQMRQFIEVGAVRTIIQAASPVKVARMAEAVRACEAAIGEAEAFAEADVAFHRALVSVVDNPIILTLHDMFVRQLLRERRSEADRHAHDRMVTEEHNRILDAIIAGDAEAATALLDAHLARSFRNRMAMRRLARGADAADAAPDPMTTQPKGRKA